jgi:hypothetical protein
MLSRPGGARKWCKDCRAEHPTQIGPVATFELSPHDKRFVFLRETVAADRNEVVLVQNWLTEMRGRARR